MIEKINALLANEHPVVKCFVIDTIIEALKQRADAVLASDGKEWPTHHIIAWRAWQDAAKVVKDAL